MVENLPFPAEILAPVRAVLVQPHAARCQKLCPISRCQSQPRVNLGTHTNTHTDTGVSIEFSQAIITFHFSRDTVRWNATGSLVVCTEIQHLCSLQEYPSWPTEPRFSHWLSTDQKMAVILGYLQDAHIAPVNIMLYVLDPQHLEHDRYQVGLYKENGKLLSLMDVIMSDPTG